MDWQFIALYPSFHLNTAEIKLLDRGMFMANKSTIPEFDGVFTRKNFLQLAIGTVTTMALNPLNAVFAAVPAGKPAGKYPAGNSMEYANIVVISDLHYYAPELGTTSQDFLNWERSDNKLLAESKNIVTSAINTVLQSNAQIVLVPGDLTKDGELVSHQQVAELLQRLTLAGKKVYVINGNHDIYNPNAWNFTSSPPTLVQNIGPSKFKEIYREFRL